VPSIDFKPEFVEAITAGHKTTTFRKVGGRVFRSGDKIHFFTGLRSKAARRFGMATVARVQILRLGEHSVDEFDYHHFIATKEPFKRYKLIGKISFNIRDHWAVQDGFRNYEQMFKWLSKTYAWVNGAPEIDKTFQRISWHYFNRVPPPSELL